ncbi:MAG TPA: hypothetical protein P5114_06670 [Hyphomicrobiaceae bacterium]|nr:hypothetical protein [Hyphomicrobiaceae bacterium]
MPRLALTLAASLLLSAPAYCAEPARNASSETPAAPASQTDATSKEPVPAEQTDRLGFKDPTQPELDGKNLPSISDTVKEMDQDNRALKKTE